MNKSEIIAQAAEYLDVFTSKMEKMPDTANVKRLVAELYAIAASAGDAPDVQGEPVYWLVRNEFEGYMQFHDHPPRDCDISPYGLDEIIPLYAAPQPSPDVSALVEALEEIAQSCDSGRHDGLPEDGPALSDVEAWLVANDALSAHRQQGGEV